MEFSQHALVSVYLTFDYCIVQCQFIFCCPLCRAPVFTSYTSVAQQNAAMQRIFLNAHVLQRKILLLNSGVNFLNFKMNIFCNFSIKQTCGRISSPTVRRRTEFPLDYSASVARQRGGCWSSQSALLSPTKVKFRIIISVSGWHQSSSQPCIATQYWNTRGASS